MTIRVWLIAVVRRTSSVKRQKEARDHGVRRLTINEHYLRINTRQGKLSSSLFTPLPLLLSRRSPGDVSGAAFLLAVHSSQLTAYCSLLTVHCLLFTVHRPHDVRWWRTGKASADLSIFPLARARVRPPLRTTTFSSSTAPPLAGAVQALRHGKVGIMTSIRCRAVAPPVMSVPYQWDPGPLGKKMSHAKTQSRKGKKRQRKT